MRRSERERHLKHIAEITKDLATRPIQGERLTYEQEQWMRRKLRSGFTKPVRDQLTELEKRGWNRRTRKLNCPAIMILVLRILKGKQ